MNKIKEIALAWGNVVSPSDEIKELAEERMKICNGCEHKTKSALNIDVCGMCYCPLLGKTHSPINSCPAKKWKE